MNATNTIAALGCLALIAAAPAPALADADLGSQGPDLGNQGPTPPTMPAPIACPQDPDPNGGIDFGDLLFILDHWGPCVPNNQTGQHPVLPDLGERQSCPGDIDQDGLIGFGDLLWVIGNFGHICKPDVSG